MLSLTQKLGKREHFAKVSETGMMGRKARKDNRKLKTMAIWMMLMLFFISELLLYTWCRVQCVGIGYEISTATKYQKELTALRSNLKVELTSLKSPARIAEIAINQLGLTTPTPKQMIIIHETR